MKKRTALPGLLALILVLTACGGKTDETEKSRSYEILDAGGQTLYTVTAPDTVKEIDDLVNAFTVGEGALAEGQEPEPLYTYVCRQDATVLAGEDPSAERDQIEVLRLTVPAEGTRVTLQVLEGSTDALSEAVPQMDLGGLLTFSYDVDADTLTALRDPAQFEKSK